MIVAQHIIGDDVVIDGVSYKKGDVVSFKTEQEQQAFIEKLVPPDPAQIAKDKVEAYVERLNAFCSKFVNDMKVENIMLDISKEKPEVVDALTTKTEVILKHIGLGSLKVAIAAIKEFPEADLDKKYLTEARLTAKRNEIHTFLGIPTVQKYNE